MNRVIRRCFLVLVCLVACVAPAAAGDWWDAMEAWSGPGPFGHRFGNYLVSVCKNDQATDKKSLRIANDAKTASDHPGRPCGYFNFGTNHADADTVKGYDAVNLQTYDFGVMWELRRAVDIGVGLGWIASESKGVNSTFLTITLLRLEVRPFCLIPNKCTGPNSASNHWARVLTVYARELVLPNGASSSDFGAPSVNYSVAHDWISSASSISFDIGEVYAALREMSR